VSTENPYESATRHNTNTEWLNEQEPLDVELDGLTDYAKNMKTLSENLRDLQSALDMLGTVPTDAWENMVLPEMAYMRHRFLGNYAELSQYLAQLQTALMNIGMAAQTVADAYRGTDGWSAASVDAVRFAFGDHSVAPPGDLPSGFNYQTYFDALNQQNQQGGGSDNRPDAQWSTPVQQPDGSFVSYNQYGEKRVLTQDGNVFTITHYDRNGNKLSEVQQTSTSVAPTSYFHFTETTTRTTYGDTQSVSRTTTARNSNPGGGYTETTTTYRGSEVTSTTTRTVEADGSQVITTTSPDGDSREIHIGADTPGGDLSDSPAEDALRRLAH